MSVDVSKTIAARSDQLNADDLIGGPMTGRVVSVKGPGTGEQPVHILLDCWPEPYKPCKTFRRVLVRAWGNGVDVPYVGRSMTVFRNPDVKWSGESVGGIEISHLSHISKPLELMLQVSRGTKKKFTILPLSDAVADWTSKISKADDLEQLKQVGAALKTASAKLPAKDVATLRSAYSARETALKSAPPDPTDLNRTNEVYHGINQRIATISSGADAQNLTDEIRDEVERGNLTTDEAAELNEHIRRVMT